MRTEQKRKPGRPRHTAKTVHVMSRISPELNAALEKITAKNRRSKNVEIAVALELYAAQEGFWPPPSNPSPE